MELRGLAPAPRHDSLAFGVRLGALLPAVLLGIFVLATYLSAEPGVFLIRLTSPGTPSRLLSLATLADAVLFFILIRTNRLRAARGALGATIVYALLVFLLSFLF